MEPRTRAGGPADVAALAALHALSRKVTYRGINGELRGFSYVGPGDPGERACRFYERGGWRHDGTVRESTIGGVVARQLRYVRPVHNRPEEPAGGPESARGIDR